MSNGSSLADVQPLRARARLHRDEGSVTAGCTADREPVPKVLDASPATKRVGVLRHRRRHFMARGIDAQSVAQALSGSRRTPPASRRSGQ